MPPDDVLSRLNDFFEEEEQSQAPEPEEEETDGMQEKRQGERQEPAEKVTTDAEEDAEEDDEEEVIENPTLHDLAEHLETDLAGIYAVTVPVTLPDGSKADVPLGEIKDSYQELKILKTERSKFEQEMEKNREEILQKGQVLDIAYIQANQMIEAAEKQLLGEIDGPEMVQLRASNPAEYAAKKQEYTEGLGKLNNMRQQAVSTYQQHMIQVQQQEAANRQAYLQNQAGVLQEKIPEWKDSRVRDAERSEITDYLIAEGIPPNEINEISSASVVAIARKAMLFDKQQKSNPKAKRKALSLGGKRITSGKTPSKIDKRNQKVMEDRKRIRDSGGSDDMVAKYIEEHILGDM